LLVVKHIINLRKSCADFQIYAAGLIILHDNDNCPMEAGMRLWQNDQLETKCVMNCVHSTMGRRELVGSLIVSE
jgi:hypothetical protein